MIVKIATKFHGGDGREERSFSATPPSFFENKVCKFSCMYYCEFSVSNAKMKRAILLDQVRGHSKDLLANKRILDKSRNFSGIMI